MNESITISYEPVAPSAKIINRKLFNLCALSVKLIKNANWFSLLLCTHEGTPHPLKQRHHNCNNRKWLCMEWSFWAWTGTYREFLYSPYIIDDLGLALRNIPPRWLAGFQWDSTTTSNACTDILEQPRSTSWVVWFWTVFEAIGFLRSLEVIGPSLTQRLGR